MNLIEGKIGEADGRRVFVSGSGTLLPLPDKYRALLPGRDVTYGIRPEHLVVSPGPTAFAAAIDLVKPMGSETQVVLSLGNYKIVGMFRERIAGKTGDMIFLDLPVEKISVFDSGTGKRI
ncbi:MAG: TOBE domain-containing protein [Shinella sp.]|jgi:multiple sugar transport system ATP-binding protein|nr:TOBE domain-containing protein [Shinella sp.]